MAFGKEKCIDKELEHHNDSHKILEPSPTETARDHGTADDGPQSWCGGDGDTIAYHRSSTLFGRPNINDRPTSDSDRCATKNTGKETSNENGFDVLACRGTESESSADKVWLYKGQALTCFDL